MGVILVLGKIIAASWAGKIFAVMKTKTGFTLMELLIVIAIMGILIAVGMASYSQAQKVGRDSRRQGDLTAIQKGLEQYFGDAGAYPTSADCSTFTANYPITNYFPVGYPADPKPGWTYNFTCATGLTYCVCATLEGKTGGGNSTNVTCTFGTGNYYCVNNLQ